VAVLGAITGRTAFRGELSDMLFQGFAIGMFNDMD